VDVVQERCTQCRIPWTKPFPNQRLGPTLERARAYTPLKCSRAFTIVLFCPIRHSPVELVDAHHDQAARQAFPDGYNLTYVNTTHEENEDEALDEEARIILDNIDLNHDSEMDDLLKSKIYRKQRGNQAIERGLYRRKMSSGGPGRLCDQPRKVRSHVDLFTLNCLHMAMAHTKPWIARIAILYGMSLRRCRRRVDTIDTLTSQSSLWFRALL
jgi:hypothetical protein